MHNNTVIDIIKNLCIKKEVPKFHEVDHVYTAMAHGYYFVKPGKDTDRFTNALMDALSKGVAEGMNNFRKAQGAGPIEAYTKDAVAKRVLKVLRKYFDSEYFEAQTAVLLNDELNDKVLLTKYLGMLDQDQLFYFKKEVEQFTTLYDLLRDFDESYLNVILTDRCRELDSAIPSIHDGVRKWFDFVRENPRFMFNYLDNSEIANILDEFVTRDRVFAGNLARTLYYTRDYEYSMLYGIMANTFERMCGAKPYGV